VSGLLIVNLLIPSYPIELNLWMNPEMLASYSFAGAYRWIDETLFRSSGLAAEEEN